ncbi:MAG: hypothetical protein V3U14_13045 [candidate division NC10 bacterium]
MNVTVLNSAYLPVANYAKNATLLRCALLDVTGDALKAGQDDVTRAVDTVISMAPADKLAGFGPDKRHYDGVQAFKNGYVELARVLIDWNAIGTTNQTTGAIYTQDAASLYAHNVTILDPGGTRSTCRLYGTGSHYPGAWHFHGTQEMNQKWNKLWPRELVIARASIDAPTIYNDVPGAVDFVVD